MGSLACASGSGRWRDDPSRVPLLALPDQVDGSLQRPGHFLISFEKSPFGSDNPGEVYRFAILTLNLEADGDNVMRILTAFLVLTIGAGPLSAQTKLKILTPEQEPRKMLHNFLLCEAQKHFDERKKLVASLKTGDEIQKRQRELKARFLAAIGGLPQEKTPLNAKVVGTLKGNGFRVENVIYESRPNHHVTAIFYIPDGKGPFPGVLVPCGHSDNGKAAEAYQRVCILMAKNGLAALCFDPIGQGERLQLLDDNKKPGIKGSTSEHNMVGIG